MEANIQEYIDILTDNRLIVKRYKPESIDVDDPRFDNFEFDENLLLSKDEYYDDELLEFIDSNLFHITTPISFELNGCSQPSNLEDFLESEFEKFRVVIVNNFNVIEKNELEQIKRKIKNSRNELGLLLSGNRKNQILILDNLISVKIDFCSDAIRFINFQPDALPIVVPPKSAEQRGVRIRRLSEKLTELTQNEIVIIFHYLKKHKLIGKEMPKNLYAKHISALTGFADEKIRQDLSHIDSNPDGTNTVKFSEYEYIQVRRVLKNMIASIEKDSEERFPTKP